MALSNYFQKRISEPILQLAKTAHAVAAEKDFSSRASKASEDEIGFRTDAFNTMLSEIQINSRALQQAQRELQLRAEDLV